ncbi:MAG: tRNA-intron lyase [Candidatus Diapherotrites archaeon]|uniref:tRNA-intron lyase n=1 Tax=Candidatus Iainarchaeum sp. TaxID=3101447 RepID=A0A8T4KRW4_9ARCH|nr:tRNA-intron lyase [Candidatus Diapherotrites archaeon]
MALLIDNKVVVDDFKKADQLLQKGFGERREHEHVLDLKEALYLLEKDSIEISDKKGKKISRPELLKIAGREETNFYTKFLVYSDMRTRGFVIKTGFKFGFDFRVYPRGKKPGEEHTQWVIHVATQGEKLTMPVLSRMVRLAGNLHTIILVAVVDSENDINYYQIDRITP